jgi:hypothetical protein
MALDQDYYKRFVDLLLPKNRVFSLVIERTLSLFFKALAIVPQEIREHLASILGDVYPATTDYLVQWSAQFGKPNGLSRDGLAAQWEAGGIQNPYDIQNVFQNAGFDVYVYEWWNPSAGTLPATARFLLSELQDFINIDYAYLYVNRIQTADNNWDYQCESGNTTLQCEPVSAGTPSCGAYTGIIYSDKEYSADGDIQYYWFLGDTTFGSFPPRVQIPSSRRAEFENLIYQLKPAHTRAMAFVEFI